MNRRQALSISVDMNNWAAVILAGGLGLRMKSNIPKVLHTICGKPMISMAVEAVKKTGIKDVVLVVPHNYEEISSAIDSKVIYATQPIPKGTGDALLKASHFLHKPKNILVTYADIPLIKPETLIRLMDQHVKRRAQITILTTSRDSNEGMGRILRDSVNNKILSVIEETETDKETYKINEVNAGIYCFDPIIIEQILPSLPPAQNGEVYLTDVIAKAAKLHIIDSIYSNSPWETLGINDRVKLAECESILRSQIRKMWMEEGVTIIDPSSTYIDLTAKLGKDTVIYPNTYLIGTTDIGTQCKIGPNTTINNSSLSAQCVVRDSVIEDSELGERIQVGPFSHIREQGKIKDDVYIGNFVEIKNSKLGQYTKVGHFSYIGDAILGTNVNVGAGTVTCNYDGNNKHLTTIGNNVFLGSDSMLVAPISIGEGSSTAAGAVVTKNIPPNHLAVGVPAKHSPRYPMK